MSELNQQEQEIVDYMKERRQVLTLAELSTGLNWSTARLMPLLAALDEKGLLKVWTGKSYPKATYYALRKP